MSAPHETIVSPHDQRVTWVELFFDLVFVRALLPRGRCRSDDGSPAEWTGRILVVERGDCPRSRRRRRVAAAGLSGTALATVAVAPGVLVVAVSATLWWSYFHTGRPILADGASGVRMTDQLSAARSP